MQTGQERQGRAWPSVGAPALESPPELTWARTGAPALHLLADEAAEQAGQGAELWEVLHTVDGDVQGLGRQEPQLGLVGVLHACPQGAEGEEGPLGAVVTSHKSPSGLGGHPSHKPKTHRPQDGVTWQGPGEMAAGLVGAGCSQTGSNPARPPLPANSAASPQGPELGAWPGHCHQLLEQGWALPLRRLRAAAQRGRQTSRWGRDAGTHTPTCTGSSRETHGDPGGSPTAKTSTSRLLRRWPAARASSWDLPSVTRISTLAASARRPAAGLRFCSSTWVSARPWEQRGRAQGSQHHPSLPAHSRSSARQHPAVPTSS